ncbi:MAG: SprT family zinc-dependent metalloprotease [Parvibaculum sp.]
MSKLVKPLALHTDTLTIAGRVVPVILRHNPRARRIIVKVNLTAGCVEVTSPSKRGFGKALAFASEQRDWIAERLQRIPQAVPFTHGAIVPFRGRDHLIRHAGLRRPDRSRSGPVWCVESDEADGLPEIHATGDEAFLQRRLLDWMRNEARVELNERVLIHAEAFDVRPSRITVRDTTTRWGSCSPTRALSFSWRLILAPAHVLDYVAAHEVAHLRHMNHGPRFWALVRQAIPQYEPAKQWLEANGPGLHRYGAVSPEPFEA